MVCRESVLPLAVYTHAKHGSALYRTMHDASFDMILHAGCSSNSRLIGAEWCTFVGYAAAPQGWQQQQPQSRQQSQPQYANFAAGMQPHSLFPQLAHMLMQQTWGQQQHRAQLIAALAVANLHIKEAAACFWQESASLQVASCMPCCISKGTAQRAAAQTFSHECVDQSGIQSIKQAVDQSTNPSII